MKITNRCILTEGGTDKNHPGQNLLDKRPPDETPWTKPWQTIEREFVQGLLSRFFVLGLLKIGGSEMRDVLSGAPEMCDKV